MSSGKWSVVIKCSGMKTRRREYILGRNAMEVMRCFKAVEDSELEY